MDQGGAFDRPTRRRRRSCSRRLKRCSRRRSKSGIKADDIKHIEINDVSTILVGDLYYNFENLFKIINSLPNKISSENVQKKNQKEKIIARKNFKNFFPLTDRTVLLYTTNRR